MQKMSPAAIRSELTIAQQQGTLVEIYNLGSDDSFDVGFVITMDSLYVLMLVIDWDGKLNCLMVTRFSSVDRVRSNTDYLTTVTAKSKVARENGYFDVWHLQHFLQTHDFTNQPLLMTLLKDSAEHHLPVVIGTNKYKGRDDFEGIITVISPRSLTMNYYNEHYLSSLWEYRVLLANVDYLRVRGYQMAQTRGVFRDIFHQ